MRRTTSLLTTAAAVAVAVSGLAMPAHAEAVVYKNRDVRTNPDEGAAEHASLDVPTGYAKRRLNWHSVGFFEEVDGGTGAVDPFISVMLMRGNQLRVFGQLAEREYVEEIRKHVVRSVKFPS